MSTIQPPPPSPTGVPVSGPAVQAFLTVARPPSGLLQLPIGSQIPVDVLTTPVQGRTEIQTPLGRFSVETSLPLKPDQSLLLQTHGTQVAGKNTLTLLVIEIAGQSVRSTPYGKPGLPISPVALDISTTSPTANAPSQNLVAPTTLALTVGSNLSATLLSTTPAFSLSANGSYVLTSANTHTNALPVIGQTPTGVPSQNPASLSQSLLSNLQQSGLSASVTPIAPSGAAVPTEPIVQQVAGSQFQLTVQSVTPPIPGANPTLASSALAPFVVGQSFTGIVTGATTSGHTVVQTAAATITIPASTPLPTGTELSFRVDTKPQIPDALKLFAPSIHREGLLLAQS